MPLRCIDPTNDDRGVHSFDLTDEEWKALEEQNRGERQLRMPCCNAKVILRRSRLGTRHFAHKARPEDCLPREETEHHIRLKTLAVERARIAGWEADCEVAGETSDGERWIADALGRKDGRTVAVEIQWSSQTHEETRRRQRRYASSGVRCLWLMKDAQSLRFDDEDVPIAGILFDPANDKDYRIRLGDGTSMNASSFLDAVFTSRFKFGHPGVRPQQKETSATVELWGVPTTCWACRASMNILLEIHVSLGRRLVAIEAGLPPWLGSHEMVDIKDVPADVVATLNPYLRGLGIGALKPRIHRQETVHGSNGCPNCDRIYLSLNSTDPIAMEDRKQMLGTFDVPPDPWRDMFPKFAPPPGPRTWHVGKELAAG